MNNQNMLAQARRGIKHLIDENPSTVIVYDQSTTSDGFGGTVINPFGTQVPKDIRCRISSEKYSVLDSAPSGFTENINSFILVDHTKSIKKDNIFEHLNKNWKIGIVETIKKFGGIIAYEANIIEAESI